jgi:hypothetical protein
MCSIELDIDINTFDTDEVDYDLIDKILMDMAQSSTVATVPIPVPQVLAVRRTKFVVGVGVGVAKCVVGVVSFLGLTAFRQRVLG